MKLCFKYWLVVIGGCVAAASTHAQTTLLGWEMTGVSEAATSVAYNTVAPHIDTTSPSGALSRGSGAAVPGSPASNVFGAAGFTATGLSGALTNSDYFTFSITVASGYTMSLTSLSFKASETTSGPTNASLFSSIGGFASASNAISSWALPSGNNSDQSVTLTGFSNLTGTVEFRIYAYGGSGSSTTDKFRFRSLAGDDLIISGTVSAVPEPSTYAALAGVLTLAGVIYKKCRQAKAIA